MKKLKFFLVVISTLIAAFWLICSIALFTITSKDGIIGGAVFFILAAVFSLPMLFYFEKKHMQSGTGQLTHQSNESKASYSDYEIPPDKLSDSVKSVTDPIEGYTLKYYYRNVEITSWDKIPYNAKIGNRVVFLQEPTNEYDDKAVRLMFVPQRIKFGYLYRGKMQDMVNDYLNRGDKVVGRLSYITFKPYKIVKIDIAFFKRKNP